MSTQKNLLTLCFATVFALGLAACGSSGGNKDTAMDEDPAKGEPEIIKPVPLGPTADEMTKAAETKAEAIGKVKVAEAFDAVDVTVTAKRTGPEIKVEGDDDFTHVMGPMYSLMHDADDDGNVVEEIVLVDHTITKPKRTSFANEHTLDAREVDADAGDDFTAVSVTVENAMLVKLDDLVAGADPAGTTRTGAGTDAEDEAYEESGTYDGAPGTYQCTATADCTVTLTRDAMGKVTTAVSIGWIFTPDDKAKVYVVDEEYASFGVWLKRTTDEDGVLTYNMVDTFADGTPPTTAVTDVDGTASYAGSALGVYVHNVLDPAGEVASATSGSFTADAELMATFGLIDVGPKAGTIATAHVNTITGTIDNFELAGGEAQKWSVELARGDITAVGSTFDGKTKGGGAQGDYSGTFRGLTGADDVAPSTVGGEFTANFLNGNVAGGFGATKQKD